MDLRYLHFLLSAYSWMTLIFCGIMLFWIFINNLSEIAVGPVKFKTAFALRSFGVLIGVTVGFSAAVGYLEEHISDELDAHFSIYSAPLEDTARKQAADFFETITHDSNTAIFAFLSETKSEGRISSVDPSVVQTVTKVVVRFFPIGFFALECALLGYVDLRELKSVFWIAAIALFIGLFWVANVNSGISKISEDIMRIARLSE